MDESSQLVTVLKGRGEKLLQDNLGADEKILVKLQATFGQAMVLTDKRLYVVKWGFQAGQTFGGKCIGFDYRNITAVEFQKHITSRLVVVLTAATQDNKKLSYWGQRGNSNNAVESDNAITYVGNTLDDAFQKAVNLARELVTKAHHETNSPIQTQEDSLEKLKKLGDLKAQGTITQDEFEVMKSKIING